MFHREIGDNETFPVLLNAGDRYIVPIPEAMHILAQLMAGDAAHGHTPAAGKIVLRQHQTQLNGDNTRIRPEHFKGISYLIQHNISWMGFFKCVVVRLEICAAQHRSKRFYFRG